MACPQAPAQIWAGSSTLDDRRQEEKAAGSLFLKILEVQCCSRFSGPVSAGVLPVVQQPLRAVGEGGLAWASHVLKWPLPQAEKTPWEQGRHSPCVTPPPPPDLPLTSRMRFVVSPRVVVGSKGFRSRRGPRSRSSGRAGWRRQPRSPARPLHTQPAGRHCRCHCRSDRRAAGTAGGPLMMASLSPGRASPSPGALSAALRGGGHAPAERPPEGSRGRDGQAGQSLLALVGNPREGSLSAMARGGRHALCTCPGACPR